MSRSHNAQMGLVTWAICVSEHLLTMVRLLNKRKEIRRMIGSIETQSYRRVIQSLFSRNLNNKCMLLQSTEPTTTKHETTALTSPLLTNLLLRDTKPQPNYKHDVADFTCNFPCLHRQPSICFYSSHHITTPKWSNITAIHPYIWTTACEPQYCRDCNADGRSI